MKKQLQTLSGLEKVVGDRCYNQSGDALKYMGSRFAVQDLDFLARKIDGDNVPM